MKSKLDQQRKVLERLRGAQRKSETDQIELTPEEALRAAVLRRNKRKPKKNRKGNGWSPVLPGSFESGKR